MCKYYQEVTNHKYKCKPLKSPTDVSQRMGLRRKWINESDTSVINYTSDSNDTSFEASTTDLLIIIIFIQNRHHSI